MPSKATTGSIPQISSVSNKAHKCKWKILRRVNFQKRISCSFKVKTILLINFDVFEIILLCLTNFLSPSLFKNKLFVRRESDIFIQNTPKHSRKKCFVLVNEKSHNSEVVALVVRGSYWTTLCLIMTRFTRPNHINLVIMETQLPLWKMNVFIAFKT